MFWSKLWLLLVCVVGAAAAAVALALPGPLTQEIEQEAGARLVRAEAAAQLILKVSARQWIDSAAQASVDAVLRESLDQASRGPADLTLVHRTVQERLKSFADKIKADLVLATDAKGRVIARAGLDEAVYKDGVEGYPVVSDALRGLRADDIWSVEGKLYRVAASPVIARERYAGAIVVGQEMGDNLAASIKQAVEADVALVLRGRVVASSAQLPVLSQLPVMVDEKHDRPTSVAIGPNNDRSYLAVSAPLGGEGHALKAALAVLAPNPAAAGSRGVLARALAIRFSSLPAEVWAMVGGAAVLSLLLGLLLLRLEVGKPLSRLEAESMSVSRGEAQRFGDEYRGGWGNIVRSVNNALDRLSARAARPGEKARVEREEVPATTVAKPAAKAAPEKEMPVYEPTVLAKRAATGPDAIDTAFVLAPIPPGSATGKRPAYQDEEQTRTSSTAEMQRMLAADAEVAATITAPQPVDDGLQTELEAVYEEFLEMKQRLGESTEGVTIEKFVAKLRANRDQLLTRFGCKAVKFQVYVKDGKAALKATPVE